jgi:hypothetical protein
MVLLELNKKFILFEHFMSFAVSFKQCSQDLFAPEGLNLKVFKI